MAYGKLLAPLGGAPVFCTITVFEHCPGTMFPAGRLPLWGPICCPTGSPVLGAQGWGGVLGVCHRGGPSGPALPENSRWSSAEWGDLRRRQLHGTVSWLHGGTLQARTGGLISPPPHHAHAHTYVTRTDMRCARVQAPMHSHAHRHAHAQRTAPSCAHTQS